MSQQPDPYDIFKPISILYISLGFQEASLNGQIDSFVYYISENWIHILNLQRNLEAQFKNEAEKYAHEDLADRFEQEYDLYHNFHPVQFANSTLFSLCSYFESRMKNLCMDIQNEFGYKIGLKDLHANSDLERFKKYMEIIAEIDFQNIESEWKRITFVQKLRNRIIHNESNIFESKNGIKNQKLYKEIIADEYLSLDLKTGIFTINDKAFLFELCETIRVLLNVLIHKIKDKIY